MSREFFINPWVNIILALIFIGLGVYVFVRNMKKKKEGEGFLNIVFGDRFFVSLLFSILGLFFLGNFFRYI